MQTDKMDGMNYAPVFSGTAAKAVGPGEFRFSVIGLDHGHIFAMANGLLEAGAELVGVYDDDQNKAEDFVKRYPGCRLMDRDAIISDSSIQLVASAIRPDRRVSLGIEVMENGKHYFCDKPGMLTYDELEAVRSAHARTGKKYMVYFGERVHVEGAVYAEKLIKEGRIGDVVAINIMAPHRLNASTRPDWFFDPRKNGGILGDIGSHQFEQLLAYTGSRTASVRYSAKGNISAKDHPGFQDFGEAVIETESGASCFVRVDWFTPDGLRAWGDGRVFIIGTKGTIEIRKYINVAEDSSGDHVFIVDGTGEYHEQVTGRIGFPFFGEFILDCLHGSDNAMTEEHVLESMRLAIEADSKAEILGGR